MYARIGERVFIRMCSPPLFDEWGHFGGVLGPWGQTEEGDGQLQGVVVIQRRMEGISHSNCGDWGGTIWVPMLVLCVLFCVRVQCGLYRKG